MHISLIYILDLLALISLFNSLCVCVCACVCVRVCLVSGGWLTDLAVMVLPSSRLIGWEGFVSLFALVNERKEGEPIQYTHTLSTERHCQGRVCVCVCVCAVRGDCFKPNILPKAD